MFFKYFWHRYVLLWWYRLWIRKDERHKSLDTDWFLYREMNEKEKIKYVADLKKRREIAHQRDIARYEKTKALFDKVSTKY